MNAAASLLTRRSLPRVGNVNECFARGFATVAIFAASFHRFNGGSTILGHVGHRFHDRFRSISKIFPGRLIDRFTSCSTSNKVIVNYELRFE